MQFDVLTLFPDIIHDYATESILGRAHEKELINIAAHNFRDFSGNDYGHVDDKPYGGGAGMILRVEPIYECLKNIKALNAGNAGKARKAKIIVMDPAGKKFDQRMAEEFSKLDRLVIVCGRYEGFDARVYDYVDERVSVGEYVLAGGELPALTIIEATSRLIPGVLGNPESLKEESFGKNDQYSMSTDQSKSKSKLHIEHCSLNISHEYPQYTRPENFKGKKVPPVLLSGDHKKIEEWRKNEQK